jgi:hypothetical protein
MERTAAEWTTGLPVFMAGGGARLDVHVSGVKRGFEAARFPFVLRPFPALRDIEERLKHDEDASSRMSVAYGLTYDAEDIGDLIRPEEVGPHVILTPPTRPMPDRDELYPK